MATPDRISLPNAVESIDATLLPQIIELYFEDKSTQRHVSLDTAKGYRNTMAPWFAFWNQRADLHHHRLSRETFVMAVDWIRSDYINSRGWRPDANAIAQCFQRLRQVLKWAYQSGCTGNVNLTDWCPILKGIPTNVLFPTVEELKIVFEQPSGEFRLRDLTLLGFLLSTGVRRMEAAKARAENITFLTPITDLRLGNDHRCYCELQNVKGDADGSRRRGRVVGICSEAGLLLKAYLRSVNRFEGPIFCMSDSAIGQIVDKYAVAAGIPKLSPHAFRRCFADYWDEQLGIGGREVLKRQLGHAVTSGDITERHYISPNLRRVAREILKVHVSPLAELGLPWDTLPVHIADE